MREIVPNQQILFDWSAWREGLKKRAEYTNFLFDLSAWRELKNGDWAPWEKPNGKSKNYKKYCARFEEFVSLQSSVPRNHFFIGNGKLVGVVKELKKLSDDLASKACALIREDKMYLFNPLVHATILFHVHKQDFLESLSEAIKRKPKAAKHGNKKSDLIFIIAFLMYEHPRLKRPRQFYKLFNRAPIREVVLGEKDGIKKHL
jgi:hypothetical protein